MRSLTLALALCAALVCASISEAAPTARNVGRSSAAVGGTGTPVNHGYYNRSFYPSSAFLYSPYQLQVPFVQQTYIQPPQIIYVQPPQQTYIQQAPVVYQQPAPVIVQPPAAVQIYQQPAPVLYNQVLQQPSYAPVCNAVASFASYNPYAAFVNSSYAINSAYYGRVNSLRTFRR